MKTILFHINTLLAGGIEKVLIELLKALDPDKYRIKLSIAHHLGDFEILKDKIPPFVEITYLLEQRVYNETRKKKIAKTIRPFEKILEDVILPSFKKKAQKLKLRELIKDVDVIIDYDMTLAPYHTLLAKKKKIAYCHFSLRHYWDGNKRKLDKLATRLNTYDKVVMLCDEMKEDVRNLYPFLANKLERIYNVVDIERIQTMAGEPLGEREDLLQHGYFVAVGRLDEKQKDFTTLIKAYAAYIKKSDATEPLVIVGHGPARKQLEELAHAEDIIGRVIFAGYQENPFKWMQNSRLFLFSSRMEGLPTVLIEALLLGKPIVATACPTGVKEILMYGKAGMLTPPGDADAFCDAMMKLHNNSALQASYIECSRDILREFDIKTEIGQFEAMIDALMSA